MEGNLKEENSANSTVTECCRHSQDQYLTQLKAETPRIQIIRFVYSGGKANQKDVLNITAGISPDIKLDRIHVDNPIWLSAAPAYSTFLLFVIL